MSLTPSPDYIALVESRARMRWREAQMLEMTRTIEALKADKAKLQCQLVEIAKKQQSTGEPWV